MSCLLPVSPQMRHLLNESKENGESKRVQTAWSLESTLNVALSMG